MSQNQWFRVLNVLSTAYLLKDPEVVVPVEVSHFELIDDMCVKVTGEINSNIEEEFLTEKECTTYLSYHEKNIRMWWIILISILLLLLMVVYFVNFYSKERR
jgi:predicted nucleic acid-binding Zn ribbon protein